MAGTVVVLGGTDYCAETMGTGTACSVWILVRALKGEYKRD